MFGVEGMRFQPTSGGIFIEVVTGFDVKIHVGFVDTRREILGTRCRGNHRERHQ